jgi:hypothetical protein
MRMCRLCAFERNDDDATRCRQCGAEMAPIVEEDETEQDSAWFHYLNIPGIGTIELVPGRALRMGRDARNEIVIPKTSADQLATIFWTDDYDEATVRDMGTAEGVKIEGAKITGTRNLKGGEEIIVGPLRMTYLRRAKPIKGAIDARRLTPKAPGAHQTVGSSGGSSNAAGPGHKFQTGAPPTKGRTAVVAANPAGVCLALERTKASGTLRVSSQRGRGFVIVVQGMPRHAAFGGLAGNSALLAILALPQGRCQMVPGVPGKGKGPRLEAAFSQVIAARKAKVEAQRKSAAVKAPPRVAPPGPPRPNTATRSVPAPPPRTATRSVQAPPRVPGHPTPAPRPGHPTPGHPTPGHPTPAPRPGQITPRPGLPAPPRPGQINRPSPRPPGAPPP